MTRLLANRMEQSAAWLVASVLMLLPSAAGAVCGFITATTPAQRALCDAADNPDVGAIVNDYGVNNVAVQQLSTQSDIQLNTTVISSPGAQRAQISCVAAQRNGVDLPGCTKEGVDALGSSSVKHRSIGEIGFSVTGTLARAEQDSVDGQTGFNADTPGIVVAADAKLAPNLLSGVALGLQQAKMEFDFQGSNSGHLDSNTIRAMAFLNYAFTTTAYAEASMGYGRSRFDSGRVCSACSTVTRNTASFSGDEYLLSVGGGNGYKILDVAFGAYVRADYLHFRTDAYAEEGPRGGVSNTRTALAVDPQSVNSLSGVLGGQAAYTVFRSNHKIRPRAKIEWVHEFADGSRTISSRFRDDPSGTHIAFLTASPERNWINAGLGLDVSGAPVWTLYFDYAHLFKRDASADQISVKFRYIF